MSSPGSGPTRLWRGAVLALVSVVLAVTGHAVAGAGLPSIGSVALVFGFAAPACWVFAARQRRPVAIASVSTGTQLAAHIVFVLDGCVVTQDGGNARMLAAHGVATLVVAKILARIDALLWLIYRFIAFVRHVAQRLGVRCLSQRALPRHAPVLPVDGFTGSCRQSRNEGAHPRRGPPILAAA